MAAMAGLSLGIMKLMLSRALKKGKSGLTFAAINSASVMPVFLLIFLVDKAAVDYKISLHNILGALLVVGGLFWAGWQEALKTAKWAIFATLAFLAHIIFLVITEFRALLLRKEATCERFSSEWFVPLLFAVATALHAVLFCSREKRLPTKKEALWGSLGGALNGVSACLFTRASEMASCRESVYIFSLFSIALIIFCNIWGRYIYHEKVHWKAALLSLSGIFISGLN